MSKEPGNILTDELWFIVANAVVGSTPAPVSLSARLVNQTSIVSESPALARKASRRITAQDGNLILEKYSQKSGSQEEEINGIVMF